MKRLLQLVIHLIGVAIILGCLYFAVQEETTMAKGDLLHLPALVLVSGGVFGLMLASYRFSRLLHIFKNLLLESPAKLEGQIHLINGRLEEICESYYREGTRALKSYAEQKHLPAVWRTLLTQLEAKISPADIRHLIHYDAKNFEEEMNGQIDILTTMGGLAPSMGLFGTVLGLIRLLAELKDFSSIGANMSLALVATLYGLTMSVLVLNPLISRLETLRDLHLKFYKQALFWISNVEFKKPSFFQNPKYYSSNVSL
ncbi:MAG: MotA/TolQ/ExbB proton channel family protein [Deltaproteobacteria bacterium]|nr:MotA/TolQ/ExbB proton channel family protein [Deltaproteobacteria bacterium]MBI4373465.1 MotA/TolQ/ExbB proton channel family protein [Deltaproteobacteria bacterium]